MISWKTGPAWIYYSRMGAFYTKFSIPTLESLLFLSRPAFLVEFLLLVVSILILYL